MAKIDPEKERQRLAQFYAGQLDGELEKVAGEAYELSDLARETLNAELEKRGLRLQLAEHAPVPVKKAPRPGDLPMEDASDVEDREAELPDPAGESDSDAIDTARDMVAIRRFRDLPEALLAKGSLESAGIECALTDENMVRMDWLIFEPAWWREAARDAGRRSGGASDFGSADSGRFRCIRRRELRTAAMP